jgi:hypothetical protein
MPSPVQKLAFKALGLEPIEFLDGSEMVRWAERQVSGWRSFTDESHRAGFSGEATNLCTKAVRSLQDLHAAATKDASSGTSFERSLTLGNEGYGRAWLPMSSREMSLVTDAIKRYGPLAASGLLDYLFNGRTVQDKNNKFWSQDHGKILGILESEKVPKRGDLRPLDQLRDEWTADQGKRIEEFDAWFNRTKEEAAELKRRFEQIEALRKPAEYWASKRKQHLGGAWALVAIIMGVAIGGGLPLISFIEKSRAEMLDSLSGKLAGAAQGVQALFMIPHALTMALAIIALLWALRLLVRMFLVQVHLHADAAERVVMVKTYLSLLVGKGELEGKAAVSDENLTIILSQLFRHESTGVFPDDSAPSLPMAEAIKVIAPSRER